MVEWTKVETQTPQPVSPSQESPSEPSEPSGERERPIAVTAMAAYQWLKAALFGQLFWNVWSAESRSSVATAAILPSGAGHDYGVSILLAVALYLVILGLGLWNLQKWALLSILPIYLLDFAFDINSGVLALSHISDLWPVEKLMPLLFGLTFADLTAFLFFASRETFIAFNAENEGKIFWWVRNVLFWVR